MESHQRPQRGPADGSEVANRWRQGIARQAASIYEAAHGNPVKDSARGVRWSLTPRVAVVLAAAVMLLGVALWVTTRSPVGAEVEPGPGAVADAGESTFLLEPDNADGEKTSAWGVARGESTNVTVHVAGHVAQPGLRELPAGARVGDAIDAAGGFLPDANRDDANLARVLIDGEQVYVPLLESASGGGELGDGEQETQVSDAGDADRSGININRADAAELEELPGVGPVLALRIEEFRDQNGPFRTLADLQAVPGIGPAMVEKIQGEAHV